MPSELERGTSHRVDVEWPRWLRWLRRAFPVLTIRTEFPLEPEDVRELELLAEIEADEERSRQPVQEVGPDGF